jgi:hypothetical protein
MEPITKLMQKIEEFDWTDTYREAWTKIKLRDHIASILLAPKMGFGVPCSH